MDNDLGAGGFALLGPVLGVWGLVALVLYVWYLWALSKLFPYLGLPAAHGWIPVWNQWQLIRRAGLPGWTVLLAIVPGLGVVTLVFTIMAIHRLNKEFGKTASYTVLGAFLPPIWAMLLASHISDGAYAGASVYTGEVAFPPLAAPPTPPTQGWNPPQAPGAPSWPGQGAPAQPVTQAWPDPAQPAVQGWPAPAAAQSQQPAAPHGWAEPAAPAAQAWPDPIQPQPAQEAAAAADAWQGLPPVPAGAMRATAPAEPSQEPNQDPDTRDPHAMNDWGFSSTTEGNYERLAAEELQARPAAPLGAHQTPEPFAWPGDADVPPPVSAVPISLPSPVPPVLPDAVHHAEPIESVPAPVAAPVGPRAAAPVPAPDAESVPAHETAAAPEPVPSIFVDPVAQTPVLMDPATPAAPSAPAPARVEPVAAQPVAAHAPAPTAAFRGGDEDDVSDHTVVVPKRARWGLELPDGDTVELVGDDIVVGRKPTAQGASAVLTVADPTRTLSKSHARLRRDGEAWTVEDLGSTNGLAVLDGAGNVTPLPAGEEFIAPERMVFGTLEVRLRRL